MKAWYKPYQLKFTQPVLTSRGSMEVKNGYYLFISDGIKTGIGECSFIEGLSIDDLDNYEKALTQTCHAIEQSDEALVPNFNRFPSIAFGYECALLDITNGGTKTLFKSVFTQGKAAIAINGLVWMGDKDFMLQQIEQKLSEGFKCIKIKVGAIDFNEEVKLLGYIRDRFSKSEIEIRLDANGAFNKNDVFRKLETLAQFDIHSIEPVKQGQWELMNEVCSDPPIAIALDEELIGVTEQQAQELIDAICPQYIILKPSLLGGFGICNTWIGLAEQYQIGWWATSALESNIGLNAIAQWVFTKNNAMVQGLGTGTLYTNNIQSPLEISEGELRFNKQRVWGL